MAIGPILGYLFMATYSISFIHFRGDYFALFGLSPYEFVLIAILLYTVYILSIQRKRITLISLDWITIAYVFFALIPVIQDLDNLYIAARDYRHLFLVPIIAYLTLPFLYDDVQQLITSFLSFTVGLFVTSFSLFPDFLRTGDRPRGYNLITLGLLSSWSVVLAFSIRKISPNFIFKSIVYTVVVVLLFIMALSVSRGVLLAFLLSSILSLFIFKNILYQKIFTVTFISFIALFFISLSVLGLPKFSPTYELSEEYKEMRRSVYRVTEPQFFLTDLNDRMSLWRRAFHIGLEKPILGKGAIWYRKLGLSTPHNIFISVFLTSGILGIVLFTSLIVVSYRTIFSLAGRKHFKDFGKFLFIALTIILIVGATNDFSGGRYLLFFILLSGISTAKKLSLKT
jgi:hypothetical protein